MDFTASPGPAICPNLRRGVGGGSGFRGSRFCCYTGLTCRLLRGPCATRGGGNTGPSQREGGREPEDSEVLFGVDAV